MTDSLVLPKYEDLSELEKLSLVNMSYSRFDTFMSCEAKYYYTYIEKHDRNFGAAATLGNIVHDTLEHSVGRGGLDLEKMHELNRANHASYDPDGLIDDELTEVGVQILDEFYERHKSDKYFIEPKQVIENELSFELIIGSARVIGYIDLVYRDENDLVSVLDYKTGKFQVPDKEVSTNLQLGLYALALSQRYPDQEVFPAELYYLRSGKRKRHEFTLPELADIYDRCVEQMDKIINSVNVGFGCTNKGFVCRYMCDFGKNGVCPKGKYVVDNWGR